MNRTELVNLDVNKLFEERSVDEIIEIEKLLDAEIDKKRNDLRSMVGDRYKDILAASDAIKSMKAISEKIVADIEEIANTCEMLMEPPSSVVIPPSQDEKFNSRHKDEERILLIQVRLAIFLNEQIWIALDQGRNLDATQYYLLALHIYMGLNLTKKEYLGKLMLLEHLKLNLITLRAKIFEKVTEKLESVEITAEETSQNLNALMLIGNETDDKLLSIFIKHRQTALQTVINSQYSSVRLQISAMVKCLITTVLLLHDCFIYNSTKNGLLWEELNNIVGEDAPPTLSRLELPITPLVTYIPDIIKEFRPKLNIKPTASSKDKSVDPKIVQTWLESTSKAVENGLEKSLQLVTTVKGLYLIREESLKMDLPNCWDKVCHDLHLPENFNIWYHLFQKLVTARAESLIATIIANSLDDIRAEIKSSLETDSRVGKNEMDLRWYTWREDQEDVSKYENNHTGLTMKTKGYSKLVVDLCQKLDTHFLALLTDVFQYLYGIEYNAQLSIPYIINDYKFKRKLVDKEQLETYLMMQCSVNCLGIPDHITNAISDSDPNYVAKLIFSARFLQACLNQCANFRRCCEFGNTAAEWQKVCECFRKTSLKLWKNWVDVTVQTTVSQVNTLNITTPKNMIGNLARWEEIEIQEQTDDKVFKSQIKVPMKPCLPLTNLLNKLNQDLCKIIPYTLPKPVHLYFIEQNVDVILKQYKELAAKDLNQIQALQYLLDVRFLVTLCVPRENSTMVSFGQNICDILRSKIDPFDLDVFYSHLQNNVKKAVSQSQSLFGCLLPSSAQLINLGAYAKPKEQESNPSLMALSTPSSNSWFPLLPVTIPSQKIPGSHQKLETADQSPKSSKTLGTAKRSQDPASIMRQSAASLFGNFSTDWFS